MFTHTFTTTIKYLVLAVIFSGVSDNAACDPDQLCPSYSVTTNGVLTRTIDGCDYTVKCKNLSLYNNQISKIPADAFNGLDASASLDLSFNQISEISDAFTGLAALEALYLYANQINETEITAGTFNALTALELLYLTDIK